MRVIIFGAGAMACLFGTRLASVADVTLLDTWRGGVEAIRRHGILIEDSHGIHAVRVQAEMLGAPVAPADLVIVLVKSWQTEAISRFLPQYLSPDGLAISLQNGLGNVEQLGAKAFPGCTAEGATLLGPGHAKAGGAGPTHVVAPSWVIDLMKSAGFEAYGCSFSEANSLLWGKLCVSCGINALSALLRIPNGELLNRPEAADLMARAARECADVARAAGIGLPFADPVSHVRDVAARTASNKSSMLQDILRGAPTECDAINGAVVREGMRLGIATPVNEVLWQLVKAAAHQSGSIFE